MQEMAIVIVKVGYPGAKKMQKKNKTKPSNKRGTMASVVKNS